MGREVRMVPKGWEHPKDKDGKYIPLMKGPFSKHLAEWLEEKDAWDHGQILDYSNWPKERSFKAKDDSYLEYESYDEYAGECPRQEHYMPEWPEGQANMLVMYEDTSEGTPISPAFETPEELAKWLADTNASAFGGMTATYEQWLGTCKSGWAVSMVMAEGKMMSGVEFFSKPDP